MKEDFNRTNEFMKYYVMFEGWFEMEELEVSEYVIGRFASRLLNKLETYIKDRETEACRRAFIAGTTVGDKDKTVEEEMKLYDDWLKERKL